jgi:hypothetical protein
MILHASCIVKIVSWYSIICMISQYDTMHCDQSNYTSYTGKEKFEKNWLVSSMSHCLHIGTIIVTRTMATSVMDMIIWWETFRMRCQRNTLILRWIVIHHILLMCFMGISWKSFCIGSTSKTVSTVQGPKRYYQAYRRWQYPLYITSVWWAHLCWVFDEEGAPSPSL